MIEMITYGLANFAGGGGRNVITKETSFALVGPSLERRVGKEREGDIFCRGSFRIARNNLVFRFKTSFTLD